MGVYRILWSSAVGGLTVAGAGAAFLFLPSGTVIAVGLCAGVAGPVVVGAIHVEAGAGPFPSPSCLRNAAACAAVGAVAVAGLVALCGVTAPLGLGFLLAVGAPAVLRRVPAPTRRSRAPRSHTMAATNTPPSPPPPRPPSFRSLSDPELCWRWRTSFAALAHTVSPGQWLSLVETRAALLDELDRRDPEGFTRWLDSGARAASNPARFLTSTHRSPPARRPRHDSER